MKIAFAFQIAFVTILGCIASGLANKASAAQPIDRDYVRTLAVPGYVVFVMEYWDGAQKVLNREGLKSAKSFASKSSTAFEIEQNRDIELFGVEPCDGDILDTREHFEGSCEDYARRHLDTLLAHPRVLFCRAFMKERGKPTQQATCFIHHLFPGSLNSVDMLEEQLVSIGALRLSRSATGSILRPDLEEAEKIAKQNHFGIWAPARSKSP